VEPQQAVAQSPMDMMDMMMGGGNMTDGTIMGDNMSLPFNMGVFSHANDVHYPQSITWVII
jgi:hypothetical protein